MKVTSDIKIGMYQNRYTLAVFLDIFSAYDNTLCIKERN